MQAGAAITTPLIHGPTNINREVIRPHTHRVLATGAVLSYLFAGTSALFNGSTSTSGFALYITACTLGIIASIMLTAAPERKQDEITKTAKHLILGSITPPLTQCSNHADARRFLAFTNFANHALLYFGHSIMQKELAWFESVLFIFSALANAALTFPKSNELGYVGYGLCTASISTILFALNVTQGTFQTNILAVANFTSIATSMVALVANAPNCSSITRSYDKVAQSTANNGSMYV